MREIEIIELDGKTYIVADEITIEGIKYVYLSNEKDNLDFLIQKISIENDIEYLNKLDSAEEFNKALQVFTKKHQNSLNTF